MSAPHKPGWLYSHNTELWKQPYKILFNTEAWVQDLAFVKITQHSLLSQFDENDFKDIPNALWYTRRIDARLLTTIDLAEIVPNTGQG